MTQREERIKIVAKIKTGANIYKKYLLGNTFLYVFNDKYIEVSFRKQDFAHLTGVDTKLSAKDLYKEAIRGTLTEKQIYFSARHPKSLCLKKVDCLQNLHQCVLSEGFILEDITTQSATYKFGFTELNFTLCFGEDLDVNANKKSEYFIVQSLRDEDCFGKSSDVFEIDYIYRKRNNEKLYTDLLFCNKVPEEIPGSIKNLIKNEKLLDIVNG